MQVYVTLHNITI